VLLDLNLPGRDGREVLSEIKSDPAIAHVPVVVLTTSAAEEDVLRSYQLHANAFVTKPVGPGRLHRRDPADRPLLRQRGAAAKLSTSVIVSAIGTPATSSADGRGTRR